MLVGALQVHDPIPPAVADARDAGQPREGLRIVQHEGVGRARIEPDVEDVGDLVVGGRVVAGRQEALRRVVREPRVGALGGEGVARCGR